MYKFYLILKSQGSVEAFAADKIFDEISLRVKSNPALVKSINAVYEFHVSKGAQTKVFVADMKKGFVGVKAGETAKPQCTIIIKDDDFIALASGTANPQQVSLLN